MFSVALVGHSLTPSELHVNGADIRIFRKPGGKWVDLDSREFSEFWASSFDLGIFVLGGNDLASASVNSVVQEAVRVVDRAKLNCRVVTVFSAEKREYSEGNRFGINHVEFNKARNEYNRKIRRLLNRKGVRVVDFGVPWLSNERSADGVHFNREAQGSFRRMVARVVRGVMGSRE